MKNGYKIFWTDFALKELENTVDYLEENWTDKELKNLAESIEETLILISQKSNTFSSFKRKKKHSKSSNSLFKYFVL